VPVRNRNFGNFLLGINPQIANLDRSYARASSLIENSQKNFIIGLYRAEDETPLLKSLAHFRPINGKNSAKACLPEFFFIICKFELEHFEVRKKLCI
jgi:hypothetical protein